MECRPKLQLRKSSGKGSPGSSTRCGQAGAAAAAAAAVVHTQGRVSETIAAMQLQSRAARAPHGAVGQCGAALVRRRQHQPAEGRKGCGPACALFLRNLQGPPSTTPQPAR